MNQIKVRIVSGYFEDRTCANLIAATAKVPGDAISAMALYEMLVSIYDETGEMVKLFENLKAKIEKKPFCFQIFIILN